MIFKRDSLKLGMVLGILAPILGLVIYYFAKFSYFPFSEFLQYFLREKKLITAIGTMCLLANVLLFTIYINSRRDNTAKGIFITTVIYGIAILMMKLLN